MKEINVSQRVKDRLLTVFSHPAWQVGEDGELFAENDYRRFEYQNNPEDGRTSVCLLVKHEDGGWDVVFELVLREDERSVRCTISVGLAWEEGQKGWGEERFYNADGVMLPGIGRYHGGREFGGSIEHREEMLFLLGDCPSRMDMEKTVELFLDQVAGLRLERPVLVAAVDEG